MKTPRRLLLLVLPVVALSISACGGLNGDDVAAVKTDSGTVHLTKAQFDRLFNYTVARSQNKTVTAQASKLAPPAFTACIAEKRKAIPAQSQRKKTSNDDLRKQCKKDYDKVRDSTLAGLLTGAWQIGEAERLGVPVRKAAVALQLEGVIKQTFQNRANYATFLKQSELKQADVDQILAASVAQQSISNILQQGDGKPATAKELATIKGLGTLDRYAASTTPPAPSAGDARRYFDANAEQFAQPETRDLRIILTTTEPKAKEAYNALKAGGSWKALATKYSVDEATKSLGGQVMQTTLAVQPPQFKDSVFKAKVGELVGPVKTDRGWYVVKVQKITYAKTPKFKDWKAQAQQAVAGQMLQAQIDRFKASFAARWGGRTTCAGDYNSLAACDADSIAPTTPVPLAPGAGAFLVFKPYDKAKADAAAQQQLQQQVQTQTAG